ncbi:hypothetical protein [Thiocapsa roseopersicina]|uniref:LPS sulfotransferase NodH n=1 Tax=Thiocapsa roseopersicina TaxID=1058 RepID=A0A1H2Y2S0_THIRO|nr:hypothetical protein [Thiocapsa roseopersicina]SDW99513.1 hypothetical protein SAMN05421783_11218 [Thiocapsa roseopersicina]
MSPIKTLENGVRLVYGVATSPLRKGNVVLFHQARSGSSVLADLMGQHPEVMWGGEIFHHFPGRRQEAVKKLKGRMLYAGRRFYGFDLQLYQLKPLGFELPDFIVQLKQLGFTHFAMLERRNLVRLVISALNARQSGVWQKKGQSKPEFKGINIDLAAAMLQFLETDQERNVVHDARGGFPVSLIGWLDYLQAGYDSLRTQLNHECMLSLEFERDIETDPTRAYRMFCDFLHITPAEVSPRLSRTTPFPLSEVVVNFSDLRSYLTATPYEWMLDG